MRLMTRQRFMRFLVFALALGASTFNVYAEADQLWNTYKGTSDRVGVSNSGSDVKIPFQVLWKYAPAGKSNGFVDWGPVFDHDTLYTPDGLNNIIALNRLTGEVIWQRQVPSNVFSVSLSEDAKILFVTTAITTKPTPTLYAFNPKNGEEIWNNMTMGQPAVGGMEGAPAIVNGVIYVQYLQYEGKSGVMAFNVADGKSIWQWSASRVSPYSPITYADGRIYVGYENKTLVCLNAANGDLVWTQSDLADLPFAATVVSNKTAYLAAGSGIYAFDAASGAVKWKKTIEGQVGHSSPVIYKNSLLFGTREGKVYALNTKDGQTEWTADVQGPIESAFAVDGKKAIVYLATQENYLYAIGAKKGEIKGQIRLSEDPRGVWKSSPVLYQGKIYVGSLDRNLYAVD